MNRAIFPGSFDPFHKAHLLIVQEATNDYDEIIIYVANNTSKKHQISLDKRFKLVSLLFEKLNSKKIKVYKQAEGELTPLFAKKMGINTIIRGVKNKDHITDYEASLSELYLDENDSLKFHYYSLPSELSSTLIREKIKDREDVSDFLPSPTLKEVINEYE